MAGGLFALGEVSLGREALRQSEDGRIATGRFSARLEFFDELAHSQWALFGEQ